MKMRKSSRAIRGHSLHAACAFALAIFQQSPAEGQDIPGVQTVYILNGRCERLATPHADLTANCGARIGHVIYVTGRTSYWFVGPGGGLISFTGTHETAEGQAGSLNVDTVDVTHGGKVDGNTATGSCTFSNPWLGKAYVRCAARTNAGEFSAAFTSDGQPPEKIGA